MHSYPQETTPAIALDRVTKRFGAFDVVTDLELVVMPGEVLGFLGPNGAGKTTTIRLITGFLRATAGTVRLFGNDMAQPSASEAARQRLGFVPDVAGLDPGAKGARLLDDLSALQGAPPVDRAGLIRALELSDGDLQRRTGRLSRGARQKINIIQGLQHRPELLVLDEPTEGLDPLAKRALFDVLDAARRRGATIFFSSHVLSEVEQLCDRVALIRKGRLVAVDRIASLRAHLQHQVSLLPAPAALPGVRDGLLSVPTVTGLKADGEYLKFGVGDLSALLTFLAPIPIADLTIEPPSLEDVFLQYYRGEIGNNG